MLKLEISGIVGEEVRVGIEFFVFFGFFFLPILRGKCLQMMCRAALFPSEEKRAVPAHPWAGQETNCNVKHVRHRIKQTCAGEIAPRRHS